MEQFKHIPKDLWPDECLHFEHDEVYRATESSDILRITDFLPWNVEHSNQKKTFRRLFKQPEYGLSLFTNLDSLKNTVSKLPALNAKTKAFAKGFTSINRGVSTRENKVHHVEYYLYDYENNSPKDDFKICEVRKEHE